MKLYLMRHGDAEDPAPGDFDGDYYRALTMRGRKRMRQMGKAMRDHGLLPDVIIASPVVRALQTAEIVAATVDPAEPLIVRRELGLDGDILALVRELMGSDIKSALLVGHEPSLSDFVVAVTEPDSWNGAFSRGMVLAIRLIPPGKAKLLYTMDTKTLQPVRFSWTGD